MNQSNRSHVVVASIAAVAAVVAGILGNYLADRWSWGLAVALLTVIAVLVGLEGAKVMVAGRSAPDPVAHQPDVATTVHAAAVVGGHVTMKRSVVATGNVDQSRTIHVHVGGLVAAIAAIVTLLALTVGTIRLAQEPGGRLAGQQPLASPAERTASVSPNTASPAATLLEYFFDKFYHAPTSNVRDHEGARLLQCAAPNLAGVDQLLVDVSAREAQFGASIKVEPTGMAVVVNGIRAHIDSNLELTAWTTDGNSQREIQRWAFDLTDEAGWRVCVASRVA